MKGLLITKQAIFNVIHFIHGIWQDQLNRLLATLWRNHAANNSKLLITLPKKIALLEIEKCLESLTEHPTNLRASKNKANNIKTTFFDFIHLVYYHPVKYANTPAHHTLSMNCRHALDTFWHEVQENQKIYGKNHAERVSQSYRKLLELIDMINSFFADLKNPHIGHKISITNEQMDKLNKLLNYLANEQLVLFKDRFQEIAAQHAEHQINHRYDHTVPTDMYDEIESFFSNIKLIETKHLKDAVGNITVSAVGSLEPACTETIIHNTPPAAVKTYKQLSRLITPKTESSARCIGAVCASSASKAKRRLLVGPAVTTSGVSAVTT